MKPLLEARGLTLRFPVTSAGLGRRRWLVAVDGVDLALWRGQTLGIVGESGCGKSSLARGLLGLLPLHAGEVWLDGQRVDRLSGEGLRGLRRRMQMVFQDPQGSLDPRHTVGESIGEPLAIFEPGLGRAEHRRRVDAALSEVGLSTGHGDRYPHELSGGQCQRVGIARALILRPDLLVCDEPVSALDVSVQGQVVNLLAGLRDRLGLSCVFISHNLAVVRHLSHEVLVMYLGRALERGARDDLYRRPLHPYTRALLDAVPSPVPGGPAATPRLGSAELPSPLEPPTGCAFHTRCPWAGAQCRQQRPALEAAGDGHWVACHRWREWPRGLAPATVAWNT